MAIAKVPENVALQQDAGRNVLFKKVNEIIEAIGENEEGDQGVEERVEELETDLPLVDGRVEQLEDAAVEAAKGLYASVLANGVSMEVSQNVNDITLREIFPFSIPADLKDYKVDLRIRSRIAFSAGVSVSGIVYNGTSLSLTALAGDLEGVQEVLFSELVDIAAAPLGTLEDHADYIVNAVTTIVGTVTDTLTFELILTSETEELAVKSVFLEMDNS